jgi:hypothetical protein
MNDFTKEELKELRSAIEVTRNELGHDDDLIDKIQSMIDNYCEHDAEISTWQHLRCVKCGAIS